MTSGKHGDDVALSAQNAQTTVVVSGDGPPGSPPVLDIHGPLDTHILEAAFHRVNGPRAEPGTSKDACSARFRLVHHSPTHHTVRFAETPTASGPHPAGLLADLLTRTPPPPRTGFGGARPATVPLESFAVTSLQHELLTDALRHPFHHVEQFSWRWHGPLDLRRFTDAWQSVFDSESLLRAAFVWDPQPRVVLHRRTAPEVVGHPHGSFADRSALMEHERRRGFDLRRPGLLRVALLSGEGTKPTGPPPYTDVLVTYHRALLDRWSVYLLLREFYRAYLAGTPLPGGERRPDLRDYGRWLNARDLAPAREFWLPDADADATATSLFHPTPGPDTGRLHSRLTPEETRRLVAWAARWGSTESSALQAVWAIILHGVSTGPEGSAASRRVGFNIAVSGRGIAFDDAARVPGPFSHALPMVVEVDPRGTVPRLVRALGDRAIDMSCYEWVAPGRLLDPFGRTSPAERATALHESTVAFEGRLRHLDTLAPELAAHGIGIERPDTVWATTSSPLTVIGQHDDQGGTVLTLLYDRARVTDAYATPLLTHSARLLRELPLTADETTTVAEVLDSLDDVALPRVRPAVQGRGHAGPLVDLRDAMVPGAGTVCLVAAPGAPDSFHTGLVRQYEGPQALMFLRAAPQDALRCASSLRSVLDPGGKLVIGGFSGAGVMAYEIARLLATESRTPPPPVVLGGAEGEDGDRALAHAIETTAGARLEE
ncbi:condensation domain-containing protein [Streptomyces canus]|uniref:condensation domain-containing protein n=1 Tax=Streptomyces canus TaxID=58343 RepID=UPI002F910513